LFKIGKSNQAMRAEGLLTTSISFTLYAE
jgi:hypothetical protein